METRILLALVLTVVMFVVAWWIEDGRAEEQTFRPIIQAAVLRILRTQNETGIRNAALYYRLVAEVSMDIRYCAYSRAIDELVKQGQVTRSIIFRGSDDCQIWYATTQQKKPGLGFPGPMDSRSWRDVSREPG